MTLMASTSSSSSFFPIQLLIVWRLQFCEVSMEWFFSLLFVFVISLMYQYIQCHAISHINVVNLALCRKHSYDRVIIRVRRLVEEKSDKRENGHERNTMKWIECCVGLGCVHYGCTHVLCMKRTLNIS